MCLYIYIVAKIEYEDIYNIIVLIVLIHTQWQNFRRHENFEVAEIQYCYVCMCIIYIHIYIHTCMYVYLNIYIYARFEYCIYVCMLCTSRIVDETLAQDRDVKYLRESGTPTCKKIEVHRKIAFNNF